MVSIGLQRYLFFILHSSFSILHFQIPFRFLAHGSPEGHLLQFAAYRRVVEQEEQQEQDAGVSYPAVDLLDADLHHLRHERLDERTEGQGRGTDGHTVHSSTVASQVVGHVVGEAVTVERRAHDAAHHHMEHVEHAQRLEEVLEGHDFLQAHHERGAQHGVGEASAGGGQVELRKVDVCREGEVVAQQVAEQCAQAHDEQAQVVEAAHVHPPVGEEAAGQDARQHGPVQADGSQRLVVHHLLIEYLFEHVLRGEEGLDQRDEQQDGQQVAVGPHPGFQVGMADVAHAADAHRQRDGDGHGQAAHDGTVPPVVELAVAEEVGHLEQQYRPEHAAQPVDAEEGELLDDAEVARAGAQVQQVDQHDAAHEQMHVAPVVVVHEVRGQQVGQLHAAQDDDVQQGEEDGEVALGRHPQLDGGQTLERSLNLADALDETHRPEQGQVGDVGRGEVAHQHACRGGHEQRLVGEAELHAEQQGEVDGHARQVGVQTHQQVFAHEGGFADHLVERAQVQAAGELEGEGEEYVNPRLQPARHEAAEHRHRERSV